VSDNHSRSAHARERAAERMQTSGELCAIAGLRKEQSQKRILITQELYWMIAQVLAGRAAITRVISRASASYPHLIGHLSEHSKRHC
jgi:hypothetical protein